LYRYTEVKTFWIHLVHCALRLRPIPLSTDWSRHSIEEIRDHVKSACELTRMMGQRSLPPPKKICTLEAQGTGGLQWAWLLRDGKYLITVSDDWIWRLWNIDSKEVLATIQLKGARCCCDWIQKPDALTIIINNRNEVNESVQFGYSLHL
jgi:WD40 repeat protein